MTSEASQRVLFLDDSPSALQTIKAALTAINLEVRIATTLGEAMRHVTTSDLVVVDFHMPGITGAQALQRLREKTTPSCPAFYLYTTDTNIAVSFREYGFDGAFTNKGNMETLQSQLSTVMRLIKMRRYMKHHKG